MNRSGRSTARVGPKQGICPPYIHRSFPFALNLLAWIEPVIISVVSGTWKDPGGGRIEILQPALAGYNTRVSGLAARTGERVHQR